MAEGVAFLEKVFDVDSPCYTKCERLNVRKSKSYVPWCDVSVSEFASRD